MTKITIITLQDKPLKKRGTKGKKGKGKEKKGKGESEKDKKGIKSKIRGMYGVQKKVIFSLRLDLREAFQIGLGQHFRLAMGRRSMEQYK